jgi:hypothetical protein
LVALRALADRQENALLSFWKILLLALVLIGVFFAISIYKRSQRRRAIGDRAAPPKSPLGHIRTIACRVCGTYVLERGAARCARADCPW